MTVALNQVPSPARRPHAGGFTLIEIMLVLMILIFMTAMVVPAISQKIEEDRLFDAGRKVEAFLRDARARAMLSGEPSLARFVKGGLSLSALSSSPATLETAQKEEEIIRLALPSGVTAEPILRRQPGAAQNPVREGIVRFTPSGFCEIPPIRIVRGKAWIEKRFNPLTALVDEETFNMP